MTKPQLRVLILDFDGVVVESNDIKTAAFRTLFARYPEQQAAMMQFHFENVSLTRFAKFEHLLQLLGRQSDAALRANLSAEFSRLTLEQVVQAQNVAGAPQLLQSIAPRLPLYLASVTPQTDLELVLQRRDQRRWFKDCFGCPPWSKPDAIREILRREQCEADEALLIGDSAGDQRSAREAGVRFLGRDSGLAFDAPRPRTVPDLNAALDVVEEMLN
ncbi:MAG: HAD hydrolase-like protein [Steroidobacteraceae bacterium]